MCKKIHRGGNAEQYNADKKYKEAVAVAVEACAEDATFADCREAVVPPVSAAAAALAANASARERSMLVRAVCQECE